MTLPIEIETFEICALMFTCCSGKSGLVYGNKIVTKVRGFFLLPRDCAFGGTQRQ